jgi:hypothetical protein
MNPYVPGYGRGRGFGRGRGWGRGWGRGGYGRAPPPPPDYYGDEPYDEQYYGPYAPEPDPKAEKEYLEGVVEHLEREMEAVKKRIGELSKGEKEASKRK